MGCLGDNVSAIGGGIHVEDSDAYCVRKDDGDPLEAQLMESGSFIPVIPTRELRTVKPPHWSKQ